MKAEQFGSLVYNNRTGILIGALLGLFSGGFIGLLFGAAVGYGLQNAFNGFKLSTLNPQQAFFEATFAVMGKLAKADGRVSENEIQFARDVMARMNLSVDKRQQAIELFTRGKQSDFDINEVMVPLARLIRHRRSVKQMFVEIQLQAAFADGDVSPQELSVIQAICTQLQISYADLEQILFRCRAEQAFHGQAYRSHQQGEASGERLADAYGVLGVSESATDAEVKRAYRKLMSQHHPDKLIAKGLPEEMMQLAKEKTQEIQAAYDRVRKARGQR
ncbi:co-chaperone DjlA [Motiliproteus sediminis]|uniref:co-chaperone DjlA n=1 Tax=Motiliproteus sediminis TaxID=1468178 RepID=UPI001AEF807A|nr:co-chaperone DjlA [Motiliproteus sediminis]